MRAFDRRDDIHSAENGPPAMTSGFQKVASIRPAFHARAFFSGLPGVASACSVFGIAAGSPPSLYDGDLLPRIDPHTVFALAPWVNRLKNALRIWMPVLRRAVD